MTNEELEKRVSALEDQIAILSTTINFIKWLAPILVAIAAIVIREVVR